MRKFFLAAVLVLVASGAQAATLNVIGGQLMGASGVLVDGALYDVQFLDGTCIDLYNGCDDVSDFTFQTEASALLASQALLDQVFLDIPPFAFDSFPYLTNGCGTYVIPIGCGSNTPYAFGFDPDDPDIPHTFRVITVIADNSGGVGTFPHDTTGLRGYWIPGSSSSGQVNRVYAVWSPIPEPSTALLLGLGLVGMAARRRV